MYLLSNRKVVIPAKKNTNLKMLANLYYTTKVYHLNLTLQLSNKYFLTNSKIQNT